MRLDVTAALLFETAALLLILTSRAAWTDPVVVWLSAASVLCWAVYGARTLNRRLRSDRVSENNR